MRAGMVPAAVFPTKPYWLSGSFMQKKKATSGCYWWNYLVNGRQNQTQLHPISHNRKTNVGGFNHVPALPSGGDFCFWDSLSTLNSAAEKLETYRSWHPQRVSQFLPVKPHELGRISRCPPDRLAVYQVSVARKMSHWCLGIQLC